MQVGHFAEIQWISSKILLSHANRTAVLQKGSSEIPEFPTTLGPRCAVLLQGGEKIAEPLGRGRLAGVGEGHGNVGLFPSCCLLAQCL